MAHLDYEVLMVDLAFQDQLDPTAILVHLVPPVRQAPWEATVKDIGERKETRVTWVCLVRVVLLVMKL